MATLTLGPSLTLNMSICFGWKGEDLQVAVVRSLLLPAVASLYFLSRSRCRSTAFTVSAFASVTGTGTVKTIHFNTH